jgi:hypothetical protein
MKKTLKYQVKKVDMDGVHFVITEQSHVGGEFKATNGIEIRSEVSPYWDQFHKVLFIRGVVTHEDTKSIVVPFESAKQVFMAIDEFNKADIGNETDKKAIADFTALLNQVEEIDKKITTMIKANPKLSNEFAKVFADRLEKALSGFGIKL